MRPSKLPVFRGLATGALFVPCLVLALATSVRAQTGQGQSIQGRVIDAQNGQPLAGALVRLLEPSGTVVTVVAADSVGRYQLSAPRPGSYRIGAEQLGYEAYRSDPVELREGDTVTFELRVRPTPIPIEGVEVSTDQVNRRLRQFLGASPGQLRTRPIRAQTIRDHANRGNDLNEMMGWLQIPNLQVLRTREGPCYQIRGRGCLPVFLDGARLNRQNLSMLPLEMLNTVVVLLPNELIAYPEGAVLLFSTGYMR